MPDPIFVVGYMHSGTTLMYQVLGKSSSLFTSMGESKFFEFMPMLQRRFPDLSDPQTLRALVEYTARDLLVGFTFEHLNNPSLPITDIPLTAAELDGLVESVRGCDHGEVFRRTFEYLTQRAGKTRWMEKTPSHVFHIEKILEAVPNARFIEITRDPRDVLASKKTRRADVWTSKRYTEEERRRKHNEKAFDPFWDALGWKSAVVAGRNAREKYPDRFMHVLYEDLVAAPEATIQKLCAFLDLPYEPGMLQVETRNSAEWSTGQAKKPGIYQSSLKRWKKTLTAGELALSQTVLHRELSDLGYDIEPMSLWSRVQAAALLMRASEELVKRLSRRWRLGGFSYFRNVVGDYRARFGMLVSRRR